LNLLVFQTAYTYDEMEKRNLSIFFTSKDLGGYFKKVITVHPIANYGKMLESHSLFAKPRLITHNDRHLFIEGSIARFKILRKVAPLNFLIAQFELFFVIRRVTKSIKIDFVRAEDPRFNGIWGFIFSRILDVPLLVGNWGNPETIRALTGKPMMPRFYRSIRAEVFVERFILRHSDLALAQNPDNMQFVLNSGVDVGKTAMFKLGNAIQLCHFESPNQRVKSRLKALNSVNPKTKILLCAFMIERRKILEDAIDVVEILIREFDVKLFVAGEGTARTHYEKYVLDKGMQKDIIFLGNISQVELSSLMVRADVILSPLTGRALAEAVLSETPVVAYDIDCHPELIKNGETGELVPFRNRREMAAKTAFILNHPEYGAQLGKAGRNFALKYMDPQSINMEQIHIYESLLT